MEDKIKFNKIKVNKSDYKAILKISLLIIIPTIIIYVAVISFITKTQIETNIKLIVAEQEQRANTINFIIKDIYNESVKDLLIIKNSDEMSSFLNNPNEFTKTEVEQMFYRFASTKKNFDQIRILNLSGKEIVRINNSSSSPVIVDSEELQDKSDNDYFIKAVNLPINNYYISDMDLNSENGVIEIPHKPIVRFATPLFNDDGKLQGVLIINYLGLDFIHILDEQFKDIEYDFIYHCLVNRDGYYLNNEDESKTFSFMYEDKEQFSFFETHPDLEEEFTTNDHGSVQKNDIVYFYKKIIPTIDILSENNEQHFWIFISKFNVSSLPILNEQLLFYLSAVDIAVLLILCVLIGYIVSVVYFRNKDREQLTLTTKIAENTNDAILITESDTKIIFVNKSFEEITGYTADEVIGLKTNYFKSGLHSPSFYSQMWDDIQNKGHWSGEVWDRKKDGLFYPKLLNIYSIKTKYSDKVDKYIGIYSDLTRIKETEANLNKLKNYNIETDLPNETLLKKLVDLSVMNNHNKPFGLFSFSVMNFNEVTFSSFGVEPNIILNDFINDIHTLISKEDFVAQISKNTFAIGLISYNSKKEVKSFCDKFFELNRKFSQKMNNNFFFEIKAGVSIYPDDDITSEGLLKSANIALEAVKESKTLKVLFSSPKIKEKVSKELKMNLLLRKAIENNELDVNYQPQVDSINGKIKGAEALMRWNSKELGSVSPFFFIPVAEKNGYIIEIGYWLIERVFDDYNKIKDKLPSNFKISINVSTIQFQDPDLVDKFVSLSEKYNVNLENFEIEITESVLVSNVEIVNEQFQKFKKLGLSIALDDFGTGFSSLSYLKNLDIDKLKIDRTFIKDYPTLDNGGIAKLIVNIANEFNLTVITEGAENKEQVDYLKSVGCTFIQGYYFSKPLCFVDFDNYIDKNK
ncbi:MAG: bifunctional diguanylate cyclase/phosphodiesterase [Pleomorphochaeta sp.]